MEIKGGIFMYQHYLDNEQLNFQMNRFLEPYYFDQKVQQEIQRACQKIRTVEDWYNQWLKLGDFHKEIANNDLASAYYQLADFFLLETDKRKTQTYFLFKETFYKSIEGYPVELSEIPYQNTFLPTAVIRKPNASKWLIFHGGFDSYLEELIRLSITYLDDLQDYNILMFEGPGQGGDLKNGLVMTHKWEIPLKSILDCYNLEEISLIGMSLGGFLAMRAASQEKRIKKVIAFDTFYSMMDSFSMNIPSQLKQLPDLSQEKNRVIANKLIDKYAKESIDLSFKINKAKEIFGKTSSVEVLKAIENYSLDGLEKEIKQKVLLLAGNADLYVPTYRTGFLQSKLINASKIETALFTAEDGGQYHCQVGNKKIAFDRIKQFLN